jgi:hypothetical protein
MYYDATGAIQGSFTLDQIARQYPNAPVSTGSTTFTPAAQLGNMYSFDQYNQQQQYNQDLAALQQNSQQSVQGGTTYRTQPAQKTLKQIMAAITQNAATQAQEDWKLDPYRANPWSLATLQYNAKLWQQQAAIDSPTMRVGQDPESLNYLMQKYGVTQQDLLRSGIPAGDLAYVLNQPQMPSSMMGNYQITGTGGGASLGEDPADQLWNMGYSDAEINKMMGTGAYSPVPTGTTAAGGNWMGSGYGTPPNVYNPVTNPTGPVTSNDWFSQGTSAGLVGGQQYGSPVAMTSKPSGPGSSYYGMDAWNNPLAMGISELADSGWGSAYGGMTQMPMLDPSAGYSPQYPNMPAGYTGGTPAPTPQGDYYIPTDSDAPIDVSGTIAPQPQLQGYVSNLPQTAPWQLTIPQSELLQKYQNLATQQANSNYYPMSLGEYFYWAGTQPGGQ